MKPHTFVRGECQACGVVQHLPLGLRDTPLDATPRPHHADPPYFAWSNDCPLCIALQAHVLQVAA